MTTRYENQKQTVPAHAGQSFSMPGRRSSLAGCRVLGHINFSLRCHICRCVILQPGSFDLCLGCAVDQNGETATILNKKECSVTNSEGFYTVIGSKKPITAKQRLALKSRWPSQTLEDRFWEKVDKSGGCWIWTARKIPQGYGQFNIQKGLWEYAHRMAWCFKRGSIPLGQCVLHHCDNPACCNPNHLWLGTQAENMADKKKKGRAARNMAKLTWEQAKEIRASRNVPPKILAERYGVCVRSIHHILSGRTWRTL